MKQTIEVVVNTGYPRFRIAITCVEDNTDTFVEAINCYTKGVGLVPAPFNFFVATVLDCGSEPAMTSGFDVE